MTVSFNNDIKPLFKRGDIRCMSRRGVLLDNYEYMADSAGSDSYEDHANARHVYCYLKPDGCTPRMPMGGDYWTQDQLELYLKWMEDGFQE
ncbi:MAG: hypothetical protein ACRBHB_17240 [Arenicella sp.]